MNQMLWSDAEIIKINRGVGGTFVIGDVLTLHKFTVH